MITALKMRKATFMFKLLKIENKGKPKKHKIFRTLMISGFLLVNIPLAYLNIYLIMAAAGYGFGPGNWLTYYGANTNIWEGGINIQWILLLLKNIEVLVEQD